MPRLVMVIVLLTVMLSRSAPGQIVINEIVTDPQQDWSDTSGGNFIPFDSVPGVAAATAGDEWVELMNVSPDAVDVTGWELAMVDSTPAVEVLGGGSAVLVFSSGGSLSDFRPGEHLVIGNPDGSMNNTMTVELRDTRATLIDSATLGPGGAPDGNASSTLDEAVARRPDGVDTDDSSIDFVKQVATIGCSNGAIPGQVVINEIVTDPQQDWSDTSGGDFIPFDSVPGVASPTTGDEWIELMNVFPVAVDVTGWELWMVDATAAVEILGSGAAVLVFSSGGSLSDFQPGEYLVIGNPVGTMADAITVELRDTTATLIDSATLGPGGAPDGNASSYMDEAVARRPDGVDTDDSSIDFEKQQATIGSSNLLFGDGFESGDTSAWSSSVGGSP